MPSFCLNSTNLKGPVPTGPGAHLRHRHVAGIDRRVARGEQRQDRGLRPLEVQHHLVIAVGRGALDIAVPGLARVAPQPQRLGGLAGQHVEGADDVPGREGLAVMPLHALLQLEGEVLVVGAPAPGPGEVGDDVLDAVLRLALVVEHQVVEQRHEGHHRRVGRLLVDRGARRVVAMVHAERAAALLCHRAACVKCTRTQNQGGREASQQGHRPHRVSFPSNRVSSRGIAGSVAAGGGVA